MRLGGRIRAAFRALVDPMHPGDPALARVFGIGHDSLSGVEVTEATVLGIPGVFSAINVIAENIASAPLNVYRREADGWSEPLEDHPLSGVLCSEGARPTTWMTGFEWRELAVRDACLWGDAPFRIETDRAGRVVSLPPLEPWASAPRGGTYSAGAVWRLPDGGRLTDAEVLRLPYKLDRYGWAMPPLEAHRTTWGTAIAARRYQAALLGNMATPQGALVTPAVLDAERARQLRQSWEERHRGSANAGRIAVLDAGIEYKQLGMSNVDAQFAELMTLTLGDISRVFRVPPHKLGDLSRATFSNIEHQSIEFVRETLLPWAERHERRFNGWLLTPAEQREFRIGYDLKGLMRGDAPTRSAYYRNLFYMSSITPNEIRRLEGLPSAGDDGDRFYVQGATVPVDLLGRLDAGDVPPTSAQAAGAGTQTGARA